MEPPGTVGAVSHRADDVVTRSGLVGVDDDVGVHEIGMRAERPDEQNDEGAGARGEGDDDLITLLRSTGVPAWTVQRSPTRLVLAATSCVGGDVLVVEVVVPPWAGAAVVGVVGVAPVLVPPRRLELMTMKWWCSWQYPSRPPMTSRCRFPIPSVPRCTGGPGRPGTTAAGVRSRSVPMPVGPVAGCPFRPPPVDRRRDRRRQRSRRRRARRSRRQRPPRHQRMAGRTRHPAEARCHPPDRHRAASQETGATNRRRQIDTARNAFTISGSNWQPAQAASSCRAFSGAIGRL